MLGLSAAALMAYQYAGALLFGLAETWAKSQETGVFRWFSWLFDSPWTAVLVKYLFVIGGRLSDYSPPFVPDPKV